jgi:hypothetical protein
MKRIALCRFVVCVGLMLLAPHWVWAQYSSAAYRVVAKTAGVLRPGLHAGSVEAALEVGSPTSAITVIPFETPLGVRMPLVSITLDDGEPHLFLIDPGTPNSAIDADFVKSQQIKIWRLPTDTNTEIDGIVPNQMVINAPVPLRAAKLPFVVQDLSYFRHSISAVVTGVLGENFLRAFIERIDFRKKQIEFFSRDNFSPPVKQVHCLSLQDEKSSYYVKATVDGKPSRFKICLTYQNTMLQDPALLAMLKPIAKLKTLTSHKGDLEQILRLQSVTIEDVKWNSPIVEHIPDPTETDNVLGLDFLTRFYVTFDLSAKQMYLEPDPDYKDDTSKWLGTGFNVTPESGRSPKVLGIVVPSPASEAGLKVGDEILELNGLPTATTSLATIFNGTKRFEGAVVKLKIQRKGEAKPRRFTLKMRRLL